jgi:tripartite-type tricarboxylate transporter receptor subunit TctC
MNQFLIPNMPVDPARDFAPIGQATTVRFVAVVPARNPARTLRDFVAQTRRQPGTYASSGVGSLQHLGTEQLIAASGAAMEHVPFRGSGQLINDVVAGHVDFAIDAESVVGPHIRSGALRGLAVMAATRSAGLPDVPTIREAGYGDVFMEGWQGLVAPAGTPGDVVQRLAQELKRALEQPAVLERLQAMAISPAYCDPGDFNAFLASERTRWGGVVERLGLRP